MKRMNLDEGVHVVGVFRITQDNLDEEEEKEATAFV